MLCEENEVPSLGKQWDLKLITNDYNNSPVCADFQIPGKNLTIDKTTSRSKRKDTIVFPTHYIFNN